MKLTSRLLLSPLWLGCLASNNSLTVSAFRPNRPLAILEHRNRHDVVMDIPRGGGVLGLPVTKENLVAFWIVYNLATGSLLPAPEKIPEQYSHKPLPVMPPGGFLEFVYENVASSCLGTALMLYLSVFKSMTSVPETIAYGSMPCCYVFWKALLKNNDLGTPKGFKALNVALFLGFYYAVFGGYGNPELLAKIFGFMVTAMGVVGSINPALVTKSAFGADLGSGSRKCGIHWMYRVFAMWGFIAYSLLFGEDAMTTAGRLMLLYSVMAFDSWKISKDVVEAGSSNPTAAVLAVLPALLGLGILK